MAWSLISLTSRKQTPKWDHGLRVTSGGQPKQHCAKEEKSEAANISGREASGVGLQITADSKTRSVEGSLVSLASHSRSAFIYSLFGHEPNNPMQRDNNIV